MHEPTEAELRERIETTRTRMGETIEAIGDRVNPERVKTELKAHAKEQVREIKDNVKMKARSTMRDVKHEVRDTGRGIWDTIRENPIPAGMVGIGLAWLLANRSEGHDHAHLGYDQSVRDGGYGYGYGLGPSVPYRQGSDRDFSQSDHEARYTGRSYSAGSPGFGNTYGNQHGGGSYGGQYRDDSGSGVVDSVRDTADDVRHAAQQGMETARERVGDAVDTVRDAAGDAVETVRDTASDVVNRAAEGFDRVQEHVGDWADHARHRAVRVEQRVEYAARENPLAAGAVAMALGLVAGLMIPETRRERQLMGDARDRFMDRAGELAHRATERVREVAHEAADSVREVVDDALPDSDSAGLQGSGSSRASGGTTSGGTASSSAAAGGTASSQRRV
jgi:ElaB/YqjD/DUF883 family membrane-anchored ribosome-binding protein